MSYDTAIVRDGIQPVAVLEISFPSGTKYYAPVDVDFLTSGKAATGKVLAMTPVRRSIHDYLSVFESNDASVDLSNTDAEFSKLLAAGAVKNIGCKIYFGETSIPFSDFAVLLAGKIDSYRLSGRKFSLVARDLFSVLPEYPATGRIDSTTFPNAYPLHVGRPIPVCYGTHANVDPVNYENDGGWPTSYVDNTAGAYKFLIAGHAVKSIDAVYGWGNDGIVSEATLTSSFGLTKFKAGTLSGDTMAYLLFTSLPVDSSGYLLDIRVDVQGKEFNGDGTGILMDNPIDVLNDLLSNYMSQVPLNIVMNRAYMLGDETALPANYTSAIGTAYTDFGYLCNETTGIFSNGDAGYELTGDTEAANDPTWQQMEDAGYVVKGGILELEKSDSILLSFCQSFSIRLFENRSGELEVYFYDMAVPATLPVYTEEDDIFKDSWNLEFVAQLQMTQGNQIVNRINFNHSYHWRLSMFSKAGMVEDTASQSKYGNTYPLDIDLKWQGAATGATDVANRIIFQFADPVPLCQFITGLRGATLELGDKVWITHAEAPSADGLGWTKQPCEIQELEYDLSQMTVSVTALSIEALRWYVLGDETSMASTWLNARKTSDEEFGYLCDDTTGTFSNGDTGKNLF